MEILYPATVIPEAEGGFLVQFLDFEEAYTDGDTLDEALFNASEVLTLTLEGRMEEGMEISEPSNAKVKGAGPHIHYITPDAKTQAALLLRQARGNRSFAELARALDTSWPAAKRLENPSHWPSLKQLDRAARVLGKRLVLSFE